MDKEKTLEERIREESMIESRTAAKYIPDDLDEVVEPLKEIQYNRRKAQLMNSSDRKGIITLAIEDFDAIYSALDAAWQQAIVDSKGGELVHRPLHEKHRREFRETLDMMEIHRKPF